MNSAAAVVGAALALFYYFSWPGRREDCFISGITSFNLVKWLKWHCSSVLVQAGRLADPMLCCDIYDSDISRAPVLHV